MDTVDHILQVQDEYRTLAEQWRTVNQQHKALDLQYGHGRESRQTRLDEINRMLSVSTTVSPDEHGEFDSQHNLRVDEGRSTWSAVPGCPYCDRINEKYGVTALRNEHSQIYRWVEELNRYIQQLDELFGRCEAALLEINWEANNLGLPSFEAKLDESGFILGTGRVANFTIRGRPVLLADTYVEYKVGDSTHYAVLGPSGEKVAHYDGEHGWNLHGFGKRVIQYEDDDVRVEAGGMFSYDTQTPTTDILIFPRDRSGDRHHFVTDDRGNVITDEYHPGKPKQKDS